jgi:hypothetical protein
MFDKIFGLQKEMIESNRIEAEEQIPFQPINQYHKFFAFAFASSFFLNFMAKWPYHHVMTNFVVCVW